MFPFLDIAGGLIGGIGKIFQNSENKKAAQKQMDFQERMSNTAHQREITDLKAAGLNPILSAKLGGASSPGGASPNIQSITEPLEHSAKSLADKAYNYKVQTAQVDNMRLQNDLLHGQIEQLNISNARAGRFTPIYEGVGSLVDKGADYFKNHDIIQDVLDAVSGSDPISADPSSAKQQNRSEASKWASGQKSFLQSLKDANRPKLTEEALRQHGIRELAKIKKRKHY